MSLAYIDRLLDAWHNGQAGRSAHLGYWPEGSRDPAATSLKQFEAAQRRLDELVMLHGQLHHGQTVVDVACGLGGLLEQFNFTWQQMHLTGVNCDPRQLEICHRLRAAESNRLSWIAGDACRLPLPDASVDRLFCVEAMFHFQSRAAFVSEALRVLKPGGRFVCTDIRLREAAEDVEVAPRFAVRAMLNDGYGPWPDPWCEQGSAAKQVHAAGFAEVTHLDISRQTLPTWGLIMPQKSDFDSDPEDAVVRSGLMLRWLHETGRLIYELVSAMKPWA